MCERKFKSYDSLYTVRYHWPILIELILGIWTPAFWWIDTTVEVENRLYHVTVTHKLNHILGVLTVARGLYIFRIVITLIGNRGVRASRVC